MIADLVHKQCVWNDSINLLDFGCGVHGNIATELCNLANHTVAVDSSKTAVDRFNTRCKLQGLAPDEVQAIYANEFWSSSKWVDYFDICVASLVYHHLNEPHVTTKLLASCIKPGGQLLIIDLQRSDKNKGFTETELYDFAHEAGLTSIRVSRGPSIRIRRTGAPTRLLTLHAIKPSL